MKWSSLFEKVLFGDPVTIDASRPKDTWSVEYAIWRLWKAKHDNPEAVVDHAVLVRQCLRWLSPVRARGDRLTADERKRLETFGVQVSLDGYLEVNPYEPAWLGEGEHGYALDGLPAIATIEESIPAEKWLQKTTGKPTWRSLAQKEACWTALTAQPGGTHLIGLPTGAGKSLLFQAIAAFSGGLTVVVVPTVALGLDQFSAAKTLPTFESLRPENYSSGEGAEAVRDAVDNRQCRLLFASPEACVSGRLRPVLERQASDGWLQWVVVDEAHIIESWGADFRIEFQLLGALVRDWRRRSNNRLRTLLLSATFTESTQELLRRLFVEDGQPWKANVVQRLRPEMHYHLQKANNEDIQIGWVTDALRHLPRPLLLYVTEKAHANQWYLRAKDLGLKRVECFHGDITNAGVRNRIMEAWRADRIDVMVATSAFGMGVDKPDVRAVIHACFPESIDRFYQEVGRSGRDGAMAQSVMIYTERDKRVGKGLAPTLLLPETVNERWAALWDSRRAIEGNSWTFEVRCDARRQGFVGVRTYQENIRWNKRLLQMMHRAGLITITGLNSKKSEGDGGEYVEWVTIKELQFSTLDLDVGARLSAVRDNELNNIQQGFAALERCVTGVPVCRELAKYYGGDVVRVCGSCRACRVGGEPKRSCGALQWPEDSPQSNPKVSIVPMPSMSTEKGRANWIMTIRKVIDDGVAERFVVTQADLALAESLFERAIGAGKLRRYRLDSPLSDQLPCIERDERVVALHLSNFHLQLDKFNHYGQSCAHWMPQDQVVDAQGRSRFTHEHAARVFDSVETWIYENPPTLG